MENSNIPAIFNYGQHEVRTVLIDGEPWFVAADVCKVLDLDNVSQAVSKLDDDEKNTLIFNDSIRGNPNKVIVNEPGLYSLILTSRKPEAKAFKRWITHEVIPAIRKTGGYSANQDLPPHQPSLEGLIRDTLPVPSREQIAALKRVVQTAEQYEQAMSAFLHAQHEAVANPVKQLSAPKQKHTLVEKVIARFHKPGDTTPTLREIARDTHTPTETIRAIMQEMLTAGQIEEFSEGRTCRYRFIRSTVAEV